MLAGPGADRRRAEHEVGLSRLHVRSNDCQVMLCSSIHAAIGRHRWLTTADSRLHFGATPVLCTSTARSGEWKRRAPVFVVIIIMP